MFRSDDVLSEVLLDRDAEGLNPPCFFRAAVPVRSNRYGDDKAIDRIDPAVAFPCRPIGARDRRPWSKPAHSPERVRATKSAKWPVRPESSSPGALQRKALSF